jgi:hypothetical protein
MTLVPEIREQLLDAAFGAAEPKTRAARRRPFGWVTIVASIAITVAVAAVFVLSVHRSATPPSGTATGLPGGPPRAWVKALVAAGSSARQHDRSCRLPPRARRSVRKQRFLTTAPPRSITSILTSLGSPAPEGLRVTVRELRKLGVDANGIYVRYAWQGRAEGVHYYVVPAAVVGTTTTPSAGCYQEEIAVFRREARRFPVGQRAAAITYAQQQLSPRAQAGVSVVTMGWGTRGESNFSVAMLAQGNANPAFDAGGGGTNSSTTTHVLVSDEVGSVTATYHAQSYPGHVARTFSVTKRPVRNFVIFHLSGAWDPPQLTFRSSTGAVIASTPHR